MTVDRDEENRSGGEDATGTEEHQLESPYMLAEQSQTMNTLTRVASRFFARLRGPMAAKGTVSVIDQAVVSGNTFITNLICVRLFTKEEFGIFAILFTIYLFLNQLQSAIVTTPLSVLSKGKGPREQRRYLSSTFLHQITLSGLICCLIVLAATFMEGLGYAESPFLPGLYALAFATVPLQVLEYLRRVLFAKFATVNALRLDAFFTAVNLILLMGVVIGQKGGVLGPSVLNPTVVFGCMGLAAMAAIAVGFRNAVHDMELAGVRWSDSLRENWSFGKWVLGSQFGSVALIQANVWVIAAIGGTAAAAVVEGTRILVAPLQVLMFGAGNLLLPFVADRYATEGENGVTKLLRTNFLLWVVPFGVYVAIIGLAPETWIRIILGEAYNGYGIVLLMWCGIYLVLGAQQFPLLCLSGMRRPDVTLFGTLIGGAASFILVALVMHTYGINWALAGRLVGEVFLTLVLTAFLFHLLKKKPSPSKGHLISSTFKEAQSERRIT